MHFKYKYTAEFKVTRWKKKIYHVNHTHEKVNVTILLPVIIDIKAIIKNKKGMP